MVLPLTSLGLEPPPWWLPPPGFAFYIPEEDYFLDQDDFPHERFARVTLATFGRWADHYQAKLVDGTRFREGVLPTDPARRATFIDDLFGELNAHALRVSWVAISLLQGKEGATLDQHDGCPGRLVVSAGQFEALQEAWAAHGLPRDAYYPPAAQRAVVEPVAVHGGVVLREQYYSPRRWQRRDAAAIARIVVPTEAERREALFVAGFDFCQALSLRMAELREAGLGAEAAEILALKALQEQVRQATRGE